VITKSQFSPTHASTKRKITDELKHNAGWYKVREGSPVEVQWSIFPMQCLYLIDSVIFDNVLPTTYCRTNSVVSVFFKSQKYGRSTWVDVTIENSSVRCELQFFCG